MEWMPASATGVIEPAGQEIPSDEFQKPRTSSLPPRCPPPTGQPVSSGSCTGTRSWSGRHSFLQRSFPDSCCRTYRLRSWRIQKNQRKGDIVLDFRKAVGDGKEWTQTLGDEGYELNLEAESPGVIFDFGAHEARGALGVCGGAWTALGGNQKDSFRPACCGTIRRVGPGALEST